MVMNKRVYIGIVPAVLLKLLDQHDHTFTSDEMMVIKAIKRSDNSLIEADIEEISSYLSHYSPAKLNGILNNVKGIYHEIRFVAAENADGDNIEADIYEITNHPGADVRLINTLTDEVTDIQLKATNSSHYVGEHQERYPNIEVFATEEVSDRLSTVESSGFSNNELTSDVSGTLNKLTEDSSYIESTVATSGLISAVINTKAVLDGKQSISSATRKTLEDLGVAGASAAVIELLVG
jgi:hypothetical protein